LGVGAISSLIYYGWNPWGPSDIVAYTTCVSCMIIIGIIGGLLKPKDKNNLKLKYNAWNIYKFGFIGLLLTLFFDISTNIVFGLVYLQGRIDIALLNPGALIFLIIHNVNNTIIFATLTVPVYNSIVSIKNYKKL